MNPEVLKQLPQLERPNALWGAIARMDGKGTWKFLVMPGEIGKDRSSNYGSSGSVGSNLGVQWSGTDNWTLSVNSLPLSGRSQKRSLDKYVESLAKFQERESGQQAPPVLSFAWGQKIFSPCVMTRFSMLERLWYPNGALAECSISFTLLQVPQEILVNK